MPVRGSARSPASRELEQHSEPAQRDRPAEPPAVQSPHTNLDARAVIALQRAAGNHATSALLAAQRVRAVQRAVPKSPGGSTKPVAETGSYQARGGKETTYNSTQHPRSKFSFGSLTRHEVLSSRGFNPMYAGNRIISVRDTASGQQVNVEGVQLDHSFSWDSIAQVMDTHNAQGNRSFTYSLWDAKMYYNDQPNLSPALGNLNASAGRSGVTSHTGQDERLAPVLGEIQTSWMNLQAGVSSVGTGLSFDAAVEVGDLLAKVRDAMNDVTDRLF